MERNAIDCRLALIWASDVVEHIERFGINANVQELRRAAAKAAHDLTRAFKNAEITTRKEHKVSPKTKPSHGALSRAPHVVRKRSRGGENKAKLILVNSSCVIQPVYRSVPEIPQNRK
jgi:hypothetical protein